MISTISAVTQQTSTKIDWPTVINSPLFIALASSGIFAAVIAFIFKFVFKLGETNTVVHTAVSDITQLKSDVRKLLSHVDVMKTHLVNSGGLQAGLFAPGSPLKLTPKGEAILELSRFKKIYEENKEWFENEVVKYNVKNDSDIDEASYKLMLKCANEKKFTDYKEIAFQNGVQLEVLIRVISIYLRDQLIKKVLNKKKPEDK